jgi:peptidoglycan/LPS O-acetylase OafA/YrhL
MHEAEPKFGFGPFGVALFFLISGFVIPFSLRNESRRTIQITGAKDFC